jgi:CRP-like cAMP-binding protein
MLIHSFTARIPEGLNIAHEPAGRPSTSGGSISRECSSMLDPVVYFSLMARVGAPTTSFQAGDVIFREGDQAWEFYVIQSGSVRIQLGERELETLGRNDIFGEMALIDETPRNATAIALTDVTLVPISEEQFISLIHDAPLFALSVMRILARRLRGSNATKTKEKDFVFEESAEA